MAEEACTASIRNLGSSYRAWTDEYTNRISVDPDHTESSELVMRYVEGSRGKSRGRLTFLL